MSEVVISAPELLEGVLEVEAGGHPIELRSHRMVFNPTAFGLTLARHLAPRLEAVAGHAVERTAELEKLLDLLRERSETLGAMAEQARWLLTDLISYDDKAASKHLKAAALGPIEDLHDRLAGLDDWSEGPIEAAFQATLEAHEGLKLGKLAQPVRVAITGSKKSPGIFDVLEVVGRNWSLARLRLGIEKCLSAPSNA